MDPSKNNPYYQGPASNEGFFSFLNYKGTTKERFKLIPEYDLLNKFAIAINTGKVTPYSDEFKEIDKSATWVHLKLTKEGDPLWVEISSLAARLDISKNHIYDCIKNKHIDLLERQIQKSISNYTADITQVKNFLHGDPKAKSDSPQSSGFIKELTKVVKNLESNQNGNNLNGLLTNFKPEKIHNNEIKKKCIEFKNYLNTLMFKKRTVEGFRLSVADIEEFKKSIIKFDESLGSIDENYSMRANSMQANEIQHLTILPWHTFEFQLVNSKASESEFLKGSEAIRLKLPIEDKDLLYLIKTDGHIYEEPKNIEGFLPFSADGKTWVMLNAQSLKNRLNISDKEFESISQKGENVFDYVNRLCSDTFSELPPEDKQLILSILGIKSLGSLAIVSGVFSQSSKIESVNRLNTGEITLKDLGLKSIKEVMDYFGKDLCEIITRLDTKSTRTNSMNEITFEDLSLLKNFKSLKSLNLANNINIKDITFLKELSTLEELDISGTSIEDINDLKYNSKLTNLNIKDTLITDISVLKNLPSLSKFCFGGAYSGAYFPHDILTLHPEPEYETKARELSKNLGVLKECNSLTSLEIGRPNYIEKAELDYLRLPKLVHFSGAVMNNYDFLIDCISLKSAYIYSINFNCPLKVFKNCTQMTKLTVEYCDDRNVDELLALENLEELVISGYSLEDISALSELRSFKKVVLGLTSRAFRYDQLQELDSKGIDCY